MTTTRHLMLRAVAVTVASALLSVPVVLASAKDEQAFVIRDSRVTESSGLARDTRAKLYWTVNDSGDQGTVYGLTTSGDVRGIIGFRARPVDVEAVAMSGQRLYVGDIGDNLRRRDMVTVYWFDNPRADNRTVPYRAYDFSYPDGPHDAETLLVDDSGRLYVVTKEAKGGIYVAPREPSRQGVNKLRRVGDAPAFVTDGVFLPGGDRIALRTYVSVVMLDGKTYRQVAQAATPFQKQGESVAVSLDGKSLLVGSEGKRAPVLQVAIPRSGGEAPAGAVKPPASAKPTPTPSATDPGAEEDSDVEVEADPPAQRTGTILALSLAGLVALIAGLVVVGARSRS
jgi:hypothetical protein